MTLVAGMMHQISMGMMVLMFCITEGEPCETLGRSKASITRLLYCPVEIKLIIAVTRDIELESQSLLVFHLSYSLTAHNLTYVTKCSSR